MLVFHNSLTKKVLYFFLPILIILAILIRIYTRLKIKKIKTFCKSYREKSSQIPNNFHSDGEEGLVIFFKLYALINRKKKKSLQSPESLDSLYTMW